MTVYYYSTLVRYHRFIDDKLFFGKSGKYNNIEKKNV